ncbi:MAG: hypothetical protein FWE10_06255 [Rikenellaceae bacterium]|nr:hypothetical protein [Rikenellaceae bacterium]MCL2691932.1 hypothetical protein [Rikenellaceae bacterium]
MKIKQYIALFAAALFVAACSNDDNGRLSPSGQDIDWFALSPSSDPTDQLRYEIYRDYGISVFYNDTIGRQERGIDGYGDPIVHYEMLDPFYYVTGFGVGNYELSTNRTAIHTAVGIIRDRIISGLIPGSRPRNILLVDRLTTTVMSGLTPVERELVIHVGLRSTIISKVGQLDGMTPAQMTAYANEVLGTMWYEYAMTNYEVQMNEFFQVSELQWPPFIASGPSQSIYRPSQLNRLLFQSGAPGDPNAVPPIPANQILNPNWRAHWNQYGFLTNSLVTTYVWENPAGSGIFTTWTPPSEEEDATSFFIAAFNYTEAEFAAIYEKPDTNPYYFLLLEKFQLIKQLIEQIKTDNQ